MAEHHPDRVSVQLELHDSGPGFIQFEAGFKPSGFGAGPLGPEPLFYGERRDVHSQCG
jgi:hypothetical protein